MNKPISVIFLCNHNSARSQMAEGLLRFYGGDSFNVVSAGLEPTEISPLAIEVMREIEIDISQFQSKSVRPYLGAGRFDHAIFVCHAFEANCPRLFPFAREHWHWLIDAPSSLPLGEIESYRLTRDMIDRHLRRWLASITQRDEVAVLEDQPNRPLT